MTISWTPSPDSPEAPNMPICYSASQINRFCSQIFDIHGLRWSIACRQSLQTLSPNRDMTLGYGTRSSQYFHETIPIAEEKCHIVEDGDDIVYSRNCFLRARGGPRYCQQSRYNQNANSGKDRFYPLSVSNFWNWELWVVSGLPIYDFSRWQKKILKIKSPVSPDSPKIQTVHFPWRITENYPIIVIYIYLQWRKWTLENCH